MRTGLIAGGAGALAFLLASTGSAQSPAPCDPGQAADVQVTTKDRVGGGKNKPLYETHEVVLAAAVQGDAGNVRLTPEPGVRIIAPGLNGRKLDVVIPRPPSLSVTVSWEQKASSDPADTTRCSATRTVSFPVLKAKPPTVRFPGKRQPRAEQHNVTFYVKPARIGGSLSPIELTFRKSARAEVPSSHVRARRWSVPMRPGERRRYAKKIPALTPDLSQAKACRYWYLSCGNVFSEVQTTGAPGILAFSQPSRWAAPAGILWQTDAIGPSPRRFGFDIQVRQDGRLIARYRRAGVCRDAPGWMGGVVNDCQVSVVKNFPR